MKKHKLLAVFLALAMTLSLLPTSALAVENSTFADGDGTSSNPYQIATVDQLKAFRDSVNEGTTYDGEYVALTGDIDLNGENWTPIGSNADSAKKFKGTFDGGNHTISNLTITATESAYKAYGLFGALNGTVQNLKLNTVRLNAISGGVSTDNGIAAVAGSIYNSGLIDHVEVSDVVISGNRYVGGIAGYVYGSITNCKVTNAVLTSTPNELGDGYDNGDKVGGIVGYSPEDIISGNTVTGVSITAYRDMGGIAGAANASKVTGNTVSGAVNLTVKRAVNAGDNAFNAGVVVGRALAGTLGENTNERATVTYVYEVSDEHELKRAAESAQNGSTIKLLSDVTLSDTLTINKSITLDGQRHKITGNVEGSESDKKSFISVTTDGAFTMKDCVIDPSAKVFANAAISIKAKGVVTVTGCSFGTDQSNGGYMYNGLEFSLEAGYPMADGTTISNNTFYGGAFRHNCISFYQMAENATININNNSFKGLNWDTSNAVRVSNYGSAPATINMNGNVYSAAGQDGNEDYAGLVLFQNNEGSCANLTVNIANLTVNGTENVTQNNAGTADQVYYVYPAESGMPTIQLGTPVVAVGSQKFTTLEAAIAAADPVDGVITYQILGKAEVTSTDAWIQILKDGITNVSKVEFVGTTNEAEICIKNSTSVLADQKYDIDVSFENLKLTHPNGTWVGDRGHATNYFTCFLRNDNASENTVTYTNCTFPNGVCNNQYGKTVFDNCKFTNTTEGKYNLWNYGGKTEVKNSEFTGTRGVKSYTEDPQPTADHIPNITISNTRFKELTQKAAILVSKATNVTVNNISVTGSNGLLTRDISGNDEVKLMAAGSNISGTFNIGNSLDAAAAKTEFNIVSGTFTSEIPSDYLASGYQVTKSGANWVVSQIPSTPSDSSSSSSSNTTTTTEKNPDGSTTTTTTDKKTGTVTEVTKETDGTTTTVETKKDGTVTETIKTPEGTTGTVVTDKGGDVTEVTASVSSSAAKEAAKTGEAVTLPVEVPAATSTEDALAVEITVPKNADAVKIEIPVENVTPGTVAVIVYEDGTEEIVPTSVITEDGVVLTLDGSATVKVIDNSKDFSDTNGHWAEDAIDFVTAREMFNGTTTTIFAPGSTMTRAMLMTVLARFDGEDTTGGDIWYEKGMEWAKANGVSDGTDPKAPITREQMVTMLYRYMGSPASDYELNFPDADSVSSYAQAAMRWAVETGLINGMDGKLDPQGAASRAQVAAIMMRFCENAAN